MNESEIKGLPPSMQKTYAALKSRFRFPDDRIYLAPISAGHVFAKKRNDAMKAFVVQGAGLSAAEDEPDGVPKPYQVFLVKEGFPGIKEGEAVPMQIQPAITTAQPTQPAIATPKPPATPAAAPVDA